MPSLSTSTQANEVFPRNASRKSIVIQNEDPTDNVFLKWEDAPNLSVSSTDHDHRLGPGGIIALNSGTDGAQQILKRLTAISSANTPRISYFETEDIRR